MIFWIKIFLLLAICLQLNSCALKQTIEVNGEMYTAHVRTGTMMRIKTPDGYEIEVDRRGRASVLEDVVKLYGLRTINE